MTLKKKAKKHSSKAFDREMWKRSEKTGEFELVSVRMKIVGKNTYYFQGKKQVTEKLFASEKEAIAYFILKMDQEVARLTENLMNMSMYRANLMIKFLGCEDRARERLRA